MKRLLFALITISALLTTFAAGQDDENREATGLPRKIGISPAGSPMIVSGRVTLEGSEQLRRQPVIRVTAMVGGIPFATTNAQKLGYYYLRDIPRQSLSLIVEVDGTEVSRQVLVASGMGNLTVDVSVPWIVLRSAVKPGVINVRDAYLRSESAEANFQKALDAGRSGNVAEAVKLFDTILNTDKDDYEAWTELGNIYFKRNLASNAEAAYYKAIELKRDYYTALINLGKLYFSLKRFDDAVLVLSNAAKANPESADAHHFLGESYLQLKKGSLAVVEFTSALKVAPDEKAELHLRLAALYDAANMKKKAVEEYKTFLKKRPDHPEKARFQKYIAENK